MHPLTLFLIWLCAVALVLCWLRGATRKAKGEEDR